MLVKIANRVYDSARVPIDIKFDEKEVKGLTNAIARGSFDGCRAIPEELNWSDDDICDWSNGILKYKKK